MNKKYDSNYHVICLLSCFVLSYLVLLKADFFSADYIPYVQIYNGTYDEINEIEPAFKYLTYFFYQFDIPYDFFAMMVCSLCLSYKVFYSRKIIPSTYGAGFLIVYICFYGFLHDLTQLRIAIAVVMCYAASYQYFFLRKRVQPLLWMSLGVLFHYSVFIWCLSLFINSYRRLFIALVSMTFGITLLLNSVNIIAAYLPSEKIISYIYNLSYSLGSVDTLSLLNLNTITFILIYISVGLLARRVSLSVNEKRFVTYVQCSGILAFFFFYIFGNVPVVAYRLAELLRIFYPLTIVLLFNKIKNGHDRIFFGFGFAICSLLMLGITFRAVSFGS